MDFIIYVHIIVEFWTRPLRILVHLRCTSGAGLGSSQTWTCHWGLVQLVAAPNPKPQVWCGFGAGSGGSRTEPWPVYTCMINLQKGLHANGNCPCLATCKHSAKLSSTIFFFITSLEVDTTTILRFEIWQQVFNSFFASVNFRMRCTSGAPGVQVQACFKPEPAIGVQFGWVAHWTLNLRFVAGSVQVWGVLELNHGQSNSNTHAYPGRFLSPVHRLSLQVYKQ